MMLVCGISDIRKLIKTKNLKISILKIFENCTLQVTTKQTIHDCSIYEEYAPFCRFVHPRISHPRFHPHESIRMNPSIKKYPHFLFLFEFDKWDRHLTYRRTVWMGKSCRMERPCKSQCLPECKCSLLIDITVSTLVVPLYVLQIIFFYY